MKKIFRLTLIWRLLLIVAAALIVSKVSLLFPYPDHRYLIELGNNMPALWSWGGFDGIHYILISRWGYVSDFTQAFFPVYPVVMSLVARITGGNALWAGLLVSNGSLLVAMELMRRLLRLDWPEKRVWQTIVLFLLFPTSFFLGSVYSESLFLGLVLGSFLAARKKQWWLAGLLGAVASATRPVGIFLFPALLVECWQQDTSRKRKFSILTCRFPIYLVPLGLLLYMWYLGTHFGDPLKFIHSQPAFGANRVDRIVLWYQVIWRYIKMLTSVPIGSLIYFRVFQEFVWSVVFLILGLVSLKKVRLSYGVFAVLAYLTPTLTGTFSSMPRYVLVMFPVFVILAGWLEKKTGLKKLWYGVSAMLLLVNMALFLTGRFVA